MGNSLQECAKELSNRQTELFNLIEPHDAKSIIRSLEEALSKHNLSFEQSKAVLSYFNWFHYES